MQNIINSHPLISLAVENIQNFLEWRNSILENPWSNFLITYVYMTTETAIGGLLLFFSVATLSYYLFFVWFKDKFLPEFDMSKINPRSEIYWSIYNVFGQALIVSVLRILLSKHSKLYPNIDDYPYWWLPVSWLLLLAFTETCVYWIHRWLHEVRWLYDNFHYYHHQFRYVSPFCGFAFHPIDALLQALPMFCAPFLFPIWEPLHTFMTIFLTVWAVSIHDNLNFVPWGLILYSGHHVIHHDKGRMKNYGQFLTIWDRIGGTYESPYEGYDQEPKKQKFENPYSTHENFIVNRRREIKLKYLQKQREKEAREKLERENECKKEKDA